MINGITTSTPSEKAISHVILGHAMFNDTRYLKRSGLIEQLTNAGYRVTTFNLSGYGSDETNSDYDFDQYVEDYRQVFDEVSKENKLPLHFIGHSVGGVIGLSTIARYHFQVANVILIAPAVWGHTIGRKLTSLKQIAIMLSASLVSKPFGKLPTKKLGLGNTPAPHSYLNQLFKWSIFRKIADKNGQSYTDDWKSYSGKIHILEAINDGKMAPPENIDFICQHLNSPQRTKISKENGFFDSDHFSIIYSKIARTESHPYITSLLSKA